MGHDLAILLAAACASAALGALDPKVGQWASAVPTHGRLSTALNRKKALTKRNMEGAASPRSPGAQVCATLNPGRRRRASGENGKKLTLRAFVRWSETSWLVEGRRLPPGVQAVGTFEDRRLRQRGRSHKQCQHPVVGRPRREGDDGAQAPRLLSTRCWGL